MVKNKDKKATIIIDTTKCVGCGNCRKVCIQDVWYWNAEEGHAEPRHYEDCFYCYQCEMSCPVKCIEVKPPVIQYYDAFARFDTDERYEKYYRKDV